MNYLVLSKGWVWIPFYWKCFCYLFCIIKVYVSHSNPFLGSMFSICFSMNGKLLLVQVKTKLFFCEREYVLTRILFQSNHHCQSWIMHASIHGAKLFDYTEHFIESICVELWKFYAHFYQQILRDIRLGLIQQGRSGQLSFDKTIYFKIYEIWEQQL